MDVVVWSQLTGEVGSALVAVTAGRICWLGFTDRGVEVAQNAFMKDWGHASPRQGRHPLMEEALRLHVSPDLPLEVRGTPFQQAVWGELRLIPRGATTTYGALAGRLGQPKASRAVGQAVGANPISWLIPCHRVLHAASGGRASGYLWGTACKERLLALEQL